MRISRWISTISLLFCCSVSLSVSAQTQDQAGTPIWQTGDAIRNFLFDAQQALLNATSGSSDSASDYQQASVALKQAAALYHQQLQPLLRPDFPDVDQAIDQASTDAQTATASGKAPASVYASGLFWTTLLGASYQATIKAIEAGDSTSALAWIRLREYRQSTRISQVNDPAAQAIGQLLPCGTNVDAVLATVNDDLLNTYTFRLRDALGQLKDAAAQNFEIRSADWTGRISGYFRILQPDFTAKRGEAETITLQGQLANLKDAALIGDFRTLSSLSDQIRETFSSYEPVALSLDDISKRAQLLYLYLDLMKVEYGRGVQNNQITLPIEVQEAVTFRNQATTLSDELRSIMIANDSSAFSTLNAKLDQMKALIDTTGSPEALQTLSDDAITAARQALRVETNSTSVAASFTIVSTILKNLEASVIAGDYTQAESQRLEAYTIVNLGISQRLRGLLPDMASRVEILFWQGDGDQPGILTLLANHASPDDVRNGLDQLNLALSTAQSTLNVVRPAPQVIISNVALNIFREGIPILILASLLAGISGLKRLRYFHWLFIGIVGIVVSLLITQLFISGGPVPEVSQGERWQEGFSLLSAVIILLIIFWFFRGVYFGDRIPSFRGRKWGILVGNIMLIPSVALLIFGFTSIAHSVLGIGFFVQSLASNTNINFLFAGVAIGILSIEIVGYIISKFQMRLPRKKMLSLTCILLAVLLPIMVGNVVHIIQSIDWIPATPIAGPYVPDWLGDWFGIFGTWQGIVLQIAALCFVITNYFIAVTYDPIVQGIPISKKGSWSS